MFFHQIKLNPFASKFFKWKFFTQTIKEEELREINEGVPRAQGGRISKQVSLDWMACMYMTWTMYSARNHHATIRPDLSTTQLKADAPLSPASEGLCICQGKKGRRLVKKRLPKTSNKHQRSERGKALRPTSKTRGNRVVKNKTEVYLTVDHVEPLTPRPAAACLPAPRSLCT